ncbi:hypothetical protein OIU77_007005 [Salix suchowensis]|uniref:Uncharacterized protein n=1 Tax=Salix suchowensis TaxID=1278906 RepID=A0ABQ9AQ76_9ROSI|nr:hypothetical protein OIU77_007005 [Salix suchowensis]
MNGWLPSLPKECRSQEISFKPIKGVNPYNLEIGPSVIPSQMMQAAENFQLPIGRNYMMSNAELQAELARVFRAGGSAGINLPMQSPLNNTYSVGGGGPGGGGCFTISGLNLNLGGAASQPMLRPNIPPAVMNQQDVITSSMMTNEKITLAENVSLESTARSADLNKS